MAFITYVYVLAAFCVANSFQTQVLNCDGQPAAQNVQITGCSSLPCSFKRGSNVQADISFVVTENTKSLKPVVDVMFGTTHVKYPLPQQDACKGLTNAECPLEKGQHVTYKLQMPIEKFYPKISLTIQLALVDQNDKTQMCVKIPSKVVD